MTAHHGSGPMARMRGGLFGKYVVLIGGMVSLVLLAGSGLGFWFFSQHNDAQLVALQREKAIAAATRIELYVRDIENQLRWTTPPRAAGDAQDLQQRHLEYLKLLKRLPEVTDVTWIDAQGRERLYVSRLNMNRFDAGTDMSSSPFFLGLKPGQVWYGPVVFRNDTEPYMAIARFPGDERDGIALAEVNLKFVGGVVTQIKVARTGEAFVTDREGHLIAHPDIDLVLQKSSLRGLPHVAAVSSGRVMRAQPEGHFVRSIRDQPVLSASAPVPGLGWNVFVELPRQEALGPLYALAWRGAIVLLAGLAVAAVASMMLARRMVQPIRALEAGAQDIGAGRLDRHIDVRTGDEIQALADQFNTMTAQLRESYATLEQKVAERTRVAEAASLAKSRFLAAASHDLRQPMHALNLYLGALHAQRLEPGARRLVLDLRLCAQTLDDLFERLLDISKLDANAVEPHMEDFEMAPVFERIALEFEPQARARGLRLRVAHCRCWVRSDPALVERIVRNLVSNAVRYTQRGRVLVGCRRNGRDVRIEVLDTGPGIAPEHQTLVFEEFYQIANSERDRAKGLGLGLSIVQRLARLLNTEVALKSTPGRGSVFTLRLPRATTVPAAPRAAPPGSPAPAPLNGTLAVVVDDDSVVLSATAQLLAQWGCEVVTAGSGAEAVLRLSESSRVPDVLLCDYRLRDGENGLDVVEALRDEFNRDVPALIVTGDVMPESAEVAHLHGFALLHKPVPDSVLRDTLSTLMSGVHSTVEAPGAASSPSRRAARAA